MGYYDALIAKWATLTGTNAAKLTAINAVTVAGPNIDVPVQSVVGLLMLSGAYLPMADFASGLTDNNVTHDTALGAAKMLMAILTIPNAPAFNTSNATNYTIIKGMVDAILAQETAASGTTGFTQAVHDAMIALAATTVPWWQSVGYSGQFSQADLDAAGGLS